ncbi:hypothetical protein ELI_3919 [Eubacterium callanderi]|uniref:Lipoprotein n=1 Tax=Eubacterium callanderi TaxID=53442 RepID=E3GGQ8_9FIRM|nr:hypothetical protein ELI_3919 [Eubacterium callanderi]
MYNRLTFCFLLNLMACAHQLVDDILNKKTSSSGLKDLLS